MDKLRVAAVSTRNWIGEPVKSIANMKRWSRRAAAFQDGAERSTRRATLWLLPGNGATEKP